MPRKPRTGPKGGEQSFTKGGLYRARYLVYPEQHEKVRKLAAERHASESAVIRDAIDGLPDPKSDK